MWFEVRGGGEWYLPPAQVTSLKVGDSSMLSSIENLFQPDVQEADKHTAAAKPPAAAPEAVQPVATPCRSAGPEPPSDPHHPKTATPSEPTSAPHDPEIPEIGDASAAIPAAGELRLSQCAINQRMSRCFKPNKKTGEYKVSKDILNMWSSRGGKKKLQQVFQSCGFDPDRLLGEAANTCCRSPLPCTRVTTIHQVPRKLVS